MKRMNGRTLRMVVQRMSSTGFICSSFAVYERTFSSSKCWRLETRHKKVVSVSFLRRKGTARFLCSASLTKEKHRLHGMEIKGPIQPLGNNVIVKLGQLETQTQSGLIIAPSAQEKPFWGKVVACGPGKNFGNTAKKFPMVVKEGDWIVFGSYGGEEISLDGESHVIISQDDVLAKLEDGKLSKEKIHPILDRVFLERIKEEDTSSSIILVKGKEPTYRGKVLGIGPGHFLTDGRFERPSLSIGQTVMHSKYAGTELTLKGKLYLLLRMADILIGMR